MPSKTRNTGLLTQNPVSPPSPLRSLILFSFTLLAIAASLPVEASGQDTSDNDDVMRVSTDLLLFPIRIRDKRGQSVRGLEQSDLALKDKDQVTAGLYFAPGAQTG